MRTSSAVPQEIAKDKKNKLFLNFFKLYSKKNLRSCRYEGEDDDAKIYFDLDENIAVELTQDCEERGMIIVRNKMKVVIAEIALTNDGSKIDVFFKLKNLGDIGEDDLLSKLVSKMDGCAKETAEAAAGGHSSRVEEEEERKAGLDMEQLSKDFDYVISKKVLKKDDFATLASIKSGNKIVILEFVKDGLRRRIHFSPEIFEFFPISEDKELFRSLKYWHIMEPHVKNYELLLEAASAIKNYALQLRMEERMVDPGFALDLYDSVEYLAFSDIEVSGCKYSNDDKRKRHVDILFTSEGFSWEITIICDEVGTKRKINILKYRADIADDVPKQEYFELCRSGMSVELKDKEGKNVDRNNELFKKAAEKIKEFERKAMDEEKTIAAGSAFVGARSGSGAASSAAVSSRFLERGYGSSFTPQAAASPGRIGGLSSESDISDPEKKGKLLLDRYIKYKKSQKNYLKNGIFIVAHGQDDPMIILPPSGMEIDLLESNNPFVLEKARRRELGLEPKEFFVIRNIGNFHWECSRKDVGGVVTDYKSSGAGNTCGLFTLSQIFKHCRHFKDKVTEVCPDISRVLEIDDVNSFHFLELRVIFANFMHSKKEELLKSIGMSEVKFIEMLSRISSPDVELYADDLVNILYAFGIKNVVEISSLKRDGDNVPDDNWAEAVFNNFNKDSRHSDYLGEMDNLERFLRAERDSFNMVTEEARDCIIALIEERRKKQVPRPGVDVVLSPSAIAAGANLFKQRK